jgi:hypothetical protein
MRSDGRVRKKPLLLKLKKAIKRSNITLLKKPLPAPAQIIAFSMRFFLLEARPYFTYARIFFLVLFPCPNNRVLV